MRGITAVVESETGKQWEKMNDYGCFGAKTIIDNVSYCVYAPIGDKALLFHAIQSWRNKHGELCMCYAETKTMDELIDWLKYEIGE